MDTDELPIDRGWAWVILIACTTTNALYCGTLKSFGIFFVEILNEFQESVSKSSLINGLLNVTYGFMSLPMLLFIMDRVGIRKLVLIGTLTMTIGYGISSQAENINFLFFSISILVGISSAFVWGPQLVAISHYFKKNYGFAVGIAVSGGCLGSLILPPIYRYLLDTYGLRGALLLAAGILSHSLVMACLLRPIEFYKKRKKISIEVTPLQNGVPKPDVIPVRTNHELVEERKEIKSNFIHQIGDALTCSQPVISKTPPSVSRLQSENGNRSRTVSEAKDFKPGMKRSIPQLPAYGTGNSSSKLSLTSLFKYISLDNVTNMSVVSIHSMPMVYDDDDDSDEILAEKKPCCKFNFSIFKKPSFILLLCVHALGTLAPALIPAFIPINAKEKGVTNAQTVVIVAVLGASEFVGRICVGYCSDKPWIKKHYIIIVSQIIAGVMANCNRYFNSFGSIIIFVIVFGSNAGAIFCVVVPILTDMIGTENFKTGYAFIMLTQGPFAAVMPYVFGYLRDITGNYNMSFHMLGSTSIAAAILLLIFRPLLHQCRSETESTEEIHIPEEKESLAP